MGWGGSGGEAKSAQRMTREAQHRTITTLGCHCGSQSWFSGCLLQWLMSYFIFSLDYQERMEHGRRASQPLNLFLFLDSSSSSPHLSDMLKNPFFQPNSIKHDFSSRVIETKWRHVSSAQSLWSVQEHTHYYISTWNSRLFFSTQKGQKLGKVDISCSLSHFFFLFSHFLSHWHYSAKGEMKRVIERGGEFSTRPIEECERVRDGRQKEREGKRRQDEKVNGGWWRQLSESQQ